MSVQDSCLTKRQYTDTVLLIGADHVGAAVSGDAVLLALIPVIWMLGVILLVAHKLRSR